MNEEEDTSNLKPTIDICSQINLMSSIQYQENELSRLANLLKSEKDREKYNKVIEMSEIIQSKLNDLQEEKKRFDNKKNSKRINSFGQPFNQKNIKWDITQSEHYSNNNSSSSRCSSSQSNYTMSTTTTDTIATNSCSSSRSSNSGNLSYINDKPSMLSFTGIHSNKEIIYIYILYYNSQHLIKSFLS